MSSINRPLPLLRAVVFGTVSLCALIVLGMSAHILSLVDGHFRLDFAGLGVATSVFTLATLPAMLIISRVRSNAMPSFIVVELSWLGFLWIMWIATAGSTASMNFTGDQCGASTVCSELNAIEGFSFLNWMMLLGYFITLLSCSIRAAQLGNTQIWETSVNEANFEGGGSNFTHDKPGQSAPTSQYPPMGA